jgi:hypothetical protein
MVNSFKNNFQLNFNHFNASKKKEFCPNLIYRYNKFFIRDANEQIFTQKTYTNPIKKNFKSRTRARAWTRINERWIREALEFCKRRSFCSYFNVYHFGDRGLSCLRSRAIHLTWIVMICWPNLCNSSHFNWNSKFSGICQTSLSKNIYPIKRYALAAIGLNSIFFAFQYLLSINRFTTTLFFIYDNLVVIKKTYYYSISFIFIKCEFNLFFNNIIVWIAL